MTQPPSYTPPSYTPNRQRPRQKRVPHPNLAPRAFLPRTRVSVLIVTLASGLLFGFSAANARHTDEKSGELVDLVRERHSVVEELDTQMSNMKNDIEKAINAEIPDNTTNANTHKNLTTKALTGPGLSVTLTDATPGPLTENVSVNDLVIHQQDIENVMNALWAGGAEAMSVQGQRITGRSIIRCIGNVIFIDGVSYSPPYVISAIGNSEKLEKTLENDPTIQNYQAYVAAYGLGWKLELSDELYMPAAQTDQAVQYAHLLEKNG